ncbi:MAG: 50S ribosomal protein L19 [Candidatus Omnitrophica bacterium 4484_49]|nr:MAG: 50S ribosomal protein L19 [Candidatus Omnitrophica bacterium 4484_49]
MDELISYVESKFQKKELPDFKVGDTVKVYTQFKEGDRTRTQIFEGIVISRKGSGIKETFTVRKISYGEGVEKIFPIHSPAVVKVDVVRRGDVKRAKLYYLRGRVGKKATRVKERIVTVKNRKESGDKNREEAPQEG